MNRPKLPVRAPIAILAAASVLGVPVLPVSGADPQPDRENNLVRPPRAPTAPIPNTNIHFRAPTAPRGPEAAAATVPPPRRRAREPREVVAPPANIDLRGDLRDDRQDRPRERRRGRGLEHGLSRDDEYWRRNHQIGPRWESWWTWPQGSGFKPRDPFGGAPFDRDHHHHGRFGHGGHIHQSVGPIFIWNDQDPRWDWRWDWVDQGQDDVYDARANTRDDRFASEPRSANSAAAPGTVRNAGQPRAARVYTPGQPAATARGQNRALERSPASGARTAARVRYESGWTDPVKVAQPPRPQRDVRPDLRMVARLTDEGRYLEAVDTLRNTVYRAPEAFNAAHGSVFDDAESRRRLAQAAEVYRRAGEQGRGVSPVDARFMESALMAALGEGDAAFDAIRDAREMGESRPSGKALHRVLSRGRLEATPTYGEDLP